MYCKQWFIGELYKYPGSINPEQYRLIETNGGVFWFECGHWCTDSVFIDLVRVKTGLQNFKDFQLELF